jgi:hypothetical protein
MAYINEEVSPGVALVGSALQRAISGGMQENQLPSGAIAPVPNSQLGAQPQQSEEPSRGTLGVKDSTEGTLGVKNSQEGTLTKFGKKE